MSRPQASKLRFLSILLAIGLVAGFVLFTDSAFAFEHGPRYFVKTNSAFWQKSFGARHVFDNGFSADLSGFQLTLTRLFGIEVEPVRQLHILPVLVQLGSETKGKSANPGAKPAKTERAKPSDQTPWGIELIYNNSAITSTSGGLGVNVAVLDTGVLKDHLDLKNRISQCKDFTHLRFPIRDGTCDDKNGHGTHISGIILADGGSDKLGIYGVAPEAGLYAYKVCDNSGSCWADDIAMALRHAADNGANVINMSLGADTESSLIREATDYATKKDVLVAAAAGNDGPYSASIDYPAANVQVLAVGAIDVNILVPDWSSRGINSTTQAYVVEEKDMEFGAPGVNVESTWKSGGYAILSGTSMASPHVAGLAAKLWQSTAPEGAKAGTTRDLLHQIAKDIWTLGDDDATGFGLPQVK